jgi:hypothetical protein
MQSVAAHVGKHAEEVRSKWVSHDGKINLTVNCDEWGQSGNDWASAVIGKDDAFSQ